MALMQMLIWWENVEDWHCPSPGLFAALYLEFPELLLISYVKPMENILPLSPKLGQGKLTSLLRWDVKMDKFDMKTKFKKQRNGSIRCRNLRSIEWYQKTYVQISWDNPLNDYSEMFSSTQLHYMENLASTVILHKIEYYNKETLLYIIWTLYSVINRAIINTKIILG
jgi:hypothetical protein